MLSDLKFAVRSLVRTPVFTITATLILALGIGANAGMFSFLSTMLLRPLPLPAVHELIVINESSRQIPNMSVAYPNFLDWRERQQSFTALGVFRGQGYAYVGTTETERLSGAQFTHDMPAVLGVAPLLGRWFNATEDKPGAPRTAVISEGFWRRSFGGQPDVLGQKLNLTGDIYTIIGVMPANFRYPISAEVWTPFGLVADQNLNRSSHNGLTALGRLKPGVSVASAQTDLAGIAQHLATAYPASNSDNSVRLISLVDRTLGQARSAAWIAFGAAFGVLLIACTNVANLLLARAASRSREFAVRAAIGASRSQLVRLLLAESLLLGVAGTALGLVIGDSVMDAVKTLIPAGSPFVTEVSMDATVFAFATIVGLGVTTLFGLVPALTSTKVNLNGALSAGGRAGGGQINARWRSVLVSSEFALTLVLLFASGLMMRTIFNLYKADTGLQASRVISFGYGMAGPDWSDPAKRARLLERTLTHLRTLPGVSQVALTNPLPLSGNGNQTTFLPEGAADPGQGKRLFTDNNAASPGYFETMGIPLLRGRTFTGEERPTDDRVCLIDARMAATHFAGQDPVGKRLQFFNGPNGTPVYSTIIGVVGHVENYGVGEDSRVQIYYSYRQLAPTFVSFVLRTEMEPAALTPAIRTAMREIEPTLPVFSIRTMDELFDQTVTNQRIMLRLLITFAGLALLLAGIGLYGVLSYIASQRTREIGIRLALGATAASVRSLLLGQGLRLTLIGLGVGLLATLGLARAMSSLVYGVSPYDPLNLGLVSLLLLVIGLLSSWLPARRATKIDPMAALRAE